MPTSSRQQVAGGSDSHEKMVTKEEQLKSDMYEDCRSSSAAGWGYMYHAQHYGTGHMAYAIISHDCCAGCGSSSTAGRNHMYDPHHDNSGHISYSLNSHDCVAGYGQHRSWMELHV